MQISVVSLALTWPLRLCLLRVLLCVSCCYKLSPFQAHWGRWYCTRFLRPACSFTIHMGSGSSAPLLCSFPPTAAFTSFPAPDCWACAAAPVSQHVCLQLTWEVGLPPSPGEFSSLCHSHKLSGSCLLGARHRFCPLQPGLACLFTVPGRSPLPTLWCSGHPTLFVMCLYCSYCLLLSFSFSPGWGLVCPGGYADLAQGCLWKYHVPLSSPCGPHLPMPSGHGRLAAARGPSWFLHSAWSEDALRRLEVWRGSKFCLFLVALPARCVSSFSPRFQFRRLAFCFLPLAAILEFSLDWF
jgi:hypothetical protein